MEVLVYGWYHSNNIGDNLFIQSFKKLFPSYNFYFVKEITEQNLFNIDAIIFGGGSFLDSNPKITDKALNIIKHKLNRQIYLQYTNNEEPKHWNAEIETQELMDIIKKSLESLSEQTRKIFLLSRNED